MRRRREMSFVIETCHVEPNAEGNTFRVVGKAEDSQTVPLAV
jgi:hypothetical protein